MTVAKAGIVVFIENEFSFTKFIYFACAKCQRLLYTL